MKSTLQRDLYAAALRLYKDEVPPERWPVYNGLVSRSGLERELRARGLDRFDRKRLASAKCQEILAEMDRQVGDRKTDDSKTKRADRKASPAQSPASAAALRRLMRQVKSLETEVARIKRREKRYRDRCLTLQAELDQTRRSQDAFSQHCFSRLRTLHV